MEHNTERRGSRWAIGFIAAALVLVLLAVVGICKANAEKYVVGVDVNPSVELGVNSFNKVCSAAGLNDEGSEILDELNLDGEDVSDAVTKVVSAMAEGGYITPDQNTALLSISGLKKEKADTLGDMLTEKIVDLTGDYGVDAAVATQIVEVIPASVGKLAAQIGVSDGRAELLTKVAAAALTTDVSQFKNFSVNDIMVLADNLGVDLGDIELTGVPSTTGYIGEKDALQAVLTKFGIKESDILAPTTKMTVGVSSVAYDVDFIFQGGNCEYSVDAKSGEAITAAQLAQKISDAVSGKDKKDKAGAAVGTAVEAASKAASGDFLGAVNTVTDAKKKADIADARKVVDYIREDTAITIALDSVGADKSSAGQVTASVDSKEDGTPMYNVDFEVGGVQYGLVIDGVTGDVSFGG